MGIAAGSMAFPRPPPATLNFQLPLFSSLKATLMTIASHLPRHRPEPESDDRDPDDRPPASLVPLPPHLIGESIKKRLPLTTISESGVLTSNGKLDLGSAPVCAVCMDGVGAREEIRRLSNCRHVFHVECLDRWIDEGHVTCPLCKSELLQDANGDDENPSCEGNPWRMERMVYLFGEDYVMNC